MSGQHKTVQLWVLKTAVDGCTSGEERTSDFREIMLEMRGGGRCNSGLVISGKGEKTGHVILELFILKLQNKKARMKNQSRRRED
jgi:hypothetical protein